MKRKEEINIAGKNKYPYIKGLPQSSSHQAIFIEGAEWADRTMLDRACEWLAEHISPEEIYEYETDETPITYLTVNSHDNMLDFINDFRQAMEGGAE